MTKEMTKEEYLAYRQEKWETFAATIKQHIGQYLTEKEWETMKFGFEKGLDTATKGGKYVNL